MPSAEGIICAAAQGWLRPPGLKWSELWNSTLPSLPPVAYIQCVC